MKSLRGYTGKKLVSFLREGDFAHAGDIESIDLVMNKFDKNPSQRILDVGCGLGGTADYIQYNNWGEVYGIDIEKESIDFAKESYKHIKFSESDVMNLDSIYEENFFDIVCLFNSFYAFRDQIKALELIHKVSKIGGKLAIFDYSDLTVGNKNPLYRNGDKTTPPFKPIQIDTIKQNLISSGWGSIDLIDISNKYFLWYDNLIIKLISKEDYIRSNWGDTAYDKALKTYSNIRNCIKNKTLGGIIIYATCC